MFTWRKPEEKEGVLAFGVVEMEGNEGRVLDDGFPCFGNEGASYDGFYW